jgi:hypothetical protein
MGKDELGRAAPRRGVGREREQAPKMEAAFDGICELTLEARAPERMVEFYERLGLRRLSRVGPTSSLSATRRSKLWALQTTLSCSEATWTLYGSVP